MTEQRSEREAQEISEANRKLRRDQSNHADTTGELPRAQQGRESVRPQPADKD